MAISRIKSLHEILFRFDADGTLQGAHQIEMERVIDGDEIVAERVGPAGAITAEAAVALLGENIPQMAAQISELKAELSPLEIDLRKLQAERDALQAELDEVRQN